MRTASQQSEEAVGDQHAFHLLRTIASGERDVEIHRRESREAVESATSALPLGKIAVRDLHLLIGVLSVGRPQHCEFPRLAERQRVQQYAGDHAKDGSIGADSEGERENQAGTQAGTPREQPQAESQVLHEGVH